MNDRFDDLTKQFGERKDRRNVLLGLGALGLGVLGVHAARQDADAKSKCNKCKDDCRKNNKNKKSNKNKKNCNNKCKDKC